MKKRITAVLVNAELIVMSLIVLIPVIWVVLSGFQTGGRRSTGLFPRI